MVDLGPYELLLSIAAEGSMGRAAAVHGVSQAAVSARIRSLEAALGLTLLERSPRGTRFTPTGALVAEWVRAAIAAAEALDAGVGALRAEQTGRLPVAASLTVAEYLLPHWLVALRDELPATSVSLSTRNSADVATDVLAGDAVLGFVEGPTIPDDLDAQVVARDELVVVVAPDHPWAARRRALDAARLAETPLVAREHGSGTRAFLEDSLAVPLAAPALELSSTTAIKNATAAGVAPAVLSSLAVAGDLAAGTLAPVRVAGLDLRRALRAVWPRGRPLTGPAARLLRIAAVAGRSAAGDRDGP
ncbi:LysR family transcriptional regulator [Actinomycetospora lutea]|uniref:LysR family transcriptional regulator n=1 Tax=Actinomycetospora lutea TaxID=663604 RepID=UPI0023650D8C|nr:LysR family transcriptional regulator [Actinomycetospora lutea]MDD7940137.1 LysR family transcriptional regulator [Actinomycetospora lutea]